MEVDDAEKQKTNSHKKTLSRSCVVNTLLRLKTVLAVRFQSIEMKIENRREKIYCRSETNRRNKIGKTRQTNERERKLNEMSDKTK